MAASNQPKGKRKKRRINVRNLILVITACFLFLSLLIGIPLYRNHKIQEARQQLLQQVIDARKQYETTISEASYTGNDQEIASYVNTIKKWALDLNKGKYDVLQALVGQKIDNAEEKELLVMDPKAEGEKYLTILGRINEIDDYWIRFLGKDQDRLNFVSEYFNQESYQNPPEELTEDLSTVPFLLQWDQRWGYIPYGDMIIAFSGCAPTSISMVASYLNNNPKITPVAVAEYAQEIGDYVNGAGTSYSIFDHAAQKYGLDIEGVPVDMGEITNALEQGKVLIAHAVPGRFTTVGHFLVIVQEENGKLIIHDPNSIKNTNTKWDPNDILPELDIIWAFSKQRS